MNEISNTGFERRGIGFVKWMDRVLAQIKAKKNKKQMGETEFFTTLVAAPLRVHIYHLQTVGGGSYAKHMALGTLYTELQPTIDKIIEVKQAQDGAVMAYDLTAFVEPKQGLSAREYLSVLRMDIETNIEEHLSSSNLNDLAQDLLTSIDQAIYKLDFLS